MCASTASRVLDYVKGQAPSLTTLIKDLVEAESPSSQPQVHDEVRRVLRLALAELKTSPDTPPAVIADEAVELAKLFGSESSPRFVNGVLGSLLG